MFIHSPHVYGILSDHLTSVVLKGGWEREKYKEKERALEEGNIQMLMDQYTLDIIPLFKHVSSFTGSHSMLPQL